MKQYNKSEAIKKYSKVIQPHELAEFDCGIVHHVYSTFYLAKDAEWSTRLFVLEMKDSDEEGIGTFIQIEHLSPALVGQQIDFYAKLEEVNGHEVICSFEAKVKERMIAKGRTGQKILKKEKIEKILTASEGE